MKMVDVDRGRAEGIALAKELAALADAEGEIDQADEYARYTEYGS